METPAPFVLCRRGLPINVTPDLFKHLPELNGLQQPLGELLAMGCIRERSLHEVFMLEKRQLIYATPWDPTQNVFGPANDNCITLETSVGRKQLSCDSFLQSILEISPDVSVLMSDHVHQAKLSKSRTRKSVTRTVEWARKILKDAKEKEDTKGTPMFFAAVEGGTILAQRKYCATALSKIEGLSGFVIAGLSTGETLYQRKEIITEVVACLPEDKPVVASTITNPLEILEAVSMGIDLFESGYPWRLTDQGLASCFEVRKGFDKQQFHPQLRGRSLSKMNLWDPCYKLDDKPVLHGCKCYTCTTHSRAYIHHLLNTHEMLAQVLLQLHNVFHFQSFFKNIRMSIKSNDFNDYRKWFEERYERVHLENANE